MLKDALILNVAILISMLYLGLFTTYEDAKRGTMSEERPEGIEKKENNYSYIKAFYNNLLTLFKLIF